MTASPSELLTGDLDPVDAATAWMNSAGWAFAFVALFALTVVFPTGHLGGGRRLSQFALGSMLAMATLIAVAPTISVSVAPDGLQMVVPNPGALLPDAGAWSVIPTSDTFYSMMLVVFAGGLVALLRAVPPRDRLAAPAVPLARGGDRCSSSASDRRLGDVSNHHLRRVDRLGTSSPTCSTYPAVPLAIVVAVLRYRLFEIDRIISRTLAYAVVTATLALVFVGVVLGLQAVLERFVGGNTIAVAASTLVVAALFQPLRRRVQAVVDRRFDRARYDAQRTADAFAAQLRDETDLETLGASSSRRSSTAPLEPAGVLGLGSWSRFGFVTKSADVDLP